MPTVEEIQKQIGSIYFTMGELDVLAIVLKDGEVINRTLSGTVKGKIGRLIATDRRLIYLTYLSPGTSNTEIFWYDDIQSITERKTKGMSGLHKDITITDTANQEFTIFQILMFHLEDFLKETKALLVHNKK